MHFSNRHNQLKRLLLKFENDIEKLLVNFTCKDCIRFKKEEIRLQEKKLQEKKPIEKKVLTWDEIEDRKDEIRKSIPVLKHEKKIDENVRDSYLRKWKENFV